MRGILVIAVATACSAGPDRKVAAPRPVAPAAPAPVASAVAGPVVPAAAPAPAVEEPAKVSLVAKLPAQDFAPPLALDAVDAAKQKQAADLNAAGLALHRKKDFAGGESKYLEALAANPGHLLARYNLACAHNLAGRSERGLTLLAELARAPGCGECEGVVDHARWDDDWRSQWGERVLWEILELEPAEEPEEAGVEEAAVEEQVAAEEQEDPNRAPKLDCPKGTKQKSEWDESTFGNQNRAWCVKPDGTQHGPFIMRWEGYDMSEGVASASGDYRNGKKHALWWESESFGHFSLGAYVEGVHHGLWVSEHNQHGDRDYTVYFRGKKESWSRSFDPEGRLASEERYENDLLHGPARRWHADGGKLHSEGAYEGGKKHGVWMVYDDAGRKRIHESWDRGVAHGVFQYWDETGKLLARTEMDHGSGDWIAYDESSVKQAEGRMLAGQRVGRWAHWDGSSRREGEYDKAGKRTGAWTYWQSDGVLLAKGSFANGKVDGAWVVYDDEGKEAQDLLFRAGKLIKVDGERANKNHQRRFKHTSFDERPEVIEEMPEEEEGPW